jgi:hypothetical protein
MRNVDRRSKVVLGVAATAFIVVNAGVAYAFWKLSGDGTATAKAGSALELTLSGVSDDNKPLYPGGTSNLSVTVANDNDFPITVNTLSPGTSRAQADETHRRSGCTTTGVIFTKDVHQVSWTVPKNSVGVFRVADGIQMTNQSDTACQGATFTIEVQATATSAAS